MTGKLVVNRAMSLDGIIPGPGHSMDWVPVLLGAGPALFSSADEAGRVNLEPAGAECAGAGCTGAGCAGAGCTGAGCTGAGCTGAVAALRYRVVRLCAS